MRRNRMAIKMKMRTNLFLALCFVGVLDLVLLLPTVQMLFWGSTQMLLSDGYSVPGGGLRAQAAPFQICTVAASPAAQL